MVTQRAEGWRIKTITIRDFRGIAGTQTLDFQCRPCLVHGDNGMGKSTIALALQWTIFGQFPEGVLPKRLSGQFMSPVGGEEGSWYGQVWLARNGQELVITRDEETQSFIVALDGVTFNDDEAELQRDSLLGLDIDTFVRTVVLQQGRIRGLLLDEVKQRNQTMDRLLGMDAAEAILECLKKKEFKDAADAWREHSARELERLKSEHELLERQHQQAEATARQSRFMGKDLNLQGLRKAYEDLGAGILKDAAEQGVPVETLPMVDSVKTAQESSRAVAAALHTIRTGAQVAKRLAAVDAHLATLLTLRNQWVGQVKARDAAKAATDALVTTCGDAKSLKGQIDAQQKEIQKREEAFRSANELYKLLDEAHRYILAHGAAVCPVCERPADDARPLMNSIQQRLETLASSAIEEAKERVTESVATLNSLERALEANTKAAGTIDNCRSALETSRKTIVQALGGAGLAETAVAKELDRVISVQESQRAAASAGAEALEVELEKIAARNTDLQTTLLPVIRAREALATCEKRIKAAEQSLVSDTKSADDMDALATDIERIRNALLEAKSDIATELLERASPRVQELYSTLVKHPLFDRISIKTCPRANKIDYSFEVSASTSKKSDREARLVLSDGQLTAAAMALLYALAESNAHNLDLLYVDDPTQNLDHRRKEAMSKVIAAMAEQTQVIISTQDEDFVTLLEDAGFTRTAVVHEFRDWDRAPTVKTTVPACETV